MAGIGRDKVARIRLRQMFNQGIISGDRAALKPISIRDAMDKYLNEDPKALSWSPRTRDDATMLYNRFVTFCHNPPRLADNGWMAAHKFRDLPPAHNMADLTPERFRQFMFSGQASVITRRGYGVRFITFLNWATAENYLAYELNEKIVETIYIPRSKALASTPDFTILTEEQIASLYTEIGRRFESGVNGFKANCLYLSLQLIQEFCLRAGDLCNLRLMDVDLENGTLYLRKRKNDKRQLVKIEPQMADELASFLRVRNSIRGAPSEPTAPLLIVYSRRKRVSGWHPFLPHLIFEQVSRLFKACGFTRMAKNGPHILRHTFATLKMKYDPRRWTLTAMKELLGHNSASTVLIYEHKIREDLRKYIDDDTRYRLVVAKPQYGRNYVQPPPPQTRFKKKPAPPAADAASDDVDERFYSFGI
jgi:integrase